MQHAQSEFQNSDKDKDGFLSKEEFLQNVYNLHVVPKTGEVNFMGGVLQKHLKTTYDTPQDMLKALLGAAFGDFEDVPKWEKPARGSSLPRGDLGAIPPIKETIAEKINRKENVRTEL